MLYAISAYECLYGGLHGMRNDFIVECDSEKEAEQIAAQASRDVMESYNEIILSLEDEAKDRSNTDELDEFFEWLVEKNIDFELYPILDTKGKTLEQLDNEFYNDPEEFIKTYCS